MRSQTSSCIDQPLNDFLSRAIEGMRFRSLTLVLLGLVVCAAEAHADNNSDPTPLTIPSSRSLRWNTGTTTHYP
jgi:hypothetical protein